MLSSNPTTSQPAWAYQAPYRPTDFPEQCYYRATNTLRMRVDGAPDDSPELTVFRFANRTTTQVRIDHDRFSLAADLDPASLRMLWLALGDALHDIGAVEADRERQESFDHISEEMREADENGGPFAYYCHPDVHYVPPKEVEAKVAELEAAGCKRYMVLPDPAEQAAA